MNQLDNLIDFEFEYIHSKYIQPTIFDPPKLTLLKFSDKFCSHCQVIKSVPWRYVNGIRYCNACGLYVKKYNRNRPVELVQQKFKTRKNVKHEVVLWYPEYKKIIVTE